MKKYIEPIVHYTTIDLNCLIAQSETKGMKDGNKLIEEFNDGEQLVKGQVSIDWDNEW